MDNNPVNLTDVLGDVTGDGEKREKVSEDIVGSGKGEESRKKYEKLKEYGVYFQLNLLALIGYYGKDVQKIAERLLENDLYDFTGTDIHNEGHIQQFISNPILLSKKNKIADLLQKNSIFL